MRSNCVLRLAGISAAMLAMVTMPAFGFSLAPECVMGGGGQFLCTNKEERMKLAKESTDLPYLEFVQWAFVAKTIRYVPDQGHAALATTEHHGGGGIDLSAAGRSGIRGTIRAAADEWFRHFCYGKGGKIVRYPINDNPDLIHVERYACHPKAVSGDDVEITQPIFGIQITTASAFGGLENDPTIVMYHLGTGEEVKKRWGYPKIYKPGDMTNRGMVIEVKVPLAKVAPESGGETWVKLVELEPRR